VPVAASDATIPATGPPTLEVVVVVADAEVVVVEAADEAGSVAVSEPTIPGTIVVVVVAVVPVAVADVVVVDELSGPVIEITMVVTTSVAEVDVWLVV
jgi:hypothetical protein